MHPTGYVEDMDAEDCNDMQEAAKKVIGRVADIIETQMLKNKKLDSGTTDENMAKTCDLVYYYKNEDNRRSGIVFGRIKEKQGSNYSVIPCNGQCEVVISYQRIRVLPQANELELESE